MGSTTALWFHIEAAFSEIESLCLEAHAAELVVRARDDEARLAQTLSRARTFDDDAAPKAPSDPRYARAAELARDVAFREAHPDGPDLVELRARVRKRLTWLKGQLAEVLSDHEVYYTLFPLVVYADELVQSAVLGGGVRWESLQSELYDIDNGGEVFYSVLEDRLRQEETHPLIFEVFYFCLSDGFRGMYASDTKRIQDAMSRLVVRIPRRDVPGSKLQPSEPRSVELVEFPWRYYAAAAATVIVGYGLLSWMGAS